MAGQESNGPRMYYQEDRGTPKGGAFWGRSTDEKQLVPMKMLLKRQTLNMIRSRESSFFQKPSCYISLCSSIDIISSMLHEFMILKISTPKSQSVARWGEFASGEAGRFDKDDLVQAKYPGSDDVYCAQVGEKSGKAFLKIVLSLQWLNWTATGAGFCLLSVVSTNQC